MKEKSGISRIFIPVTNNKNHQKTAQTGTFTVGGRSKPLPVAVVFLLLGVLLSGSVTAAKMEMHKQMDAYGIKLGMTISEARALMESKGGELKRSNLPSTQWHTLPAGSGNWMYYFSYTASLESEKKPSTPPQTRVRSAKGLPPGFSGVGIANSDSPSVTLYTYPTVKGRTTDPDTLVIYAIKSGLLFDPQHITSVEMFASNIEGKYGPPRELISSGSTVDFAVLPDVSTGTGYSIADLTSNTAYRKVHRMDEICATMRENVMGFAGRPFMGPSTYNFDKIRTGPRQMNPAKLTSCGEVSRIHLRINAPASTDIKSGSFTRYDYAHFERAMRAFAECKTRGVASCVGLGS